MQAWSHPLGLSLGQSGVHSSFIRQPHLASRGIEWHPRIARKHRIHVLQHWSSEIVEDYMSCEGSQVRRSLSLKVWCNLSILYARRPGFSMTISKRFFCLFVLGCNHYLNFLVASQRDAVHCGMQGATGTRRLTARNNDNQQQYNDAHNDPDPHLHVLPPHLFANAIRAAPEALSRLVEVLRFVL